MARDATDLEKARTMEKEGRLPCKSNVFCWQGKRSSRLASRWTLLSFVFLTSRTVHLELTEHKTRVSVRKKEERKGQRTTLRYTCERGQQHTAPEQG